MLSSASTTARPVAPCIFVKISVAQPAAVSVRVRDALGRSSRYVAGIQLLSLTLCKQHAVQRIQTSLCPLRRPRCQPLAASANGNRQQAFVYAQQSQAALPNTDAQGAKQWIAAWRAKPSGAKLNGASANGTGSNQAGQAPAPKGPGEAPPKSKRPAKATTFDNVNRFIVPEDKTEEFEATWREREAGMQHLPGFLGFSLDRQQDSDYSVTSKWASIPEWEAYSLSETARRTHLPWGVYQYVPAKGEGFPEDFIPFKQMDTMVNAKY